MPRRIVFDIRTLADSKGHSDGIVRTLKALTRYAASGRPDVVFAIFDIDHDGFRAIDPRWIAPILNGAKVDTSHFIDPLGHSRRLRARLPLPLRRIAHALQRPRRRAFVWLEGLRARAERPTPRLDRLQNALLSDKLMAELRAPGGGRRALLPFDLATGPVLTLTNDDIVFVAGFDWSAMYRIAAYALRPGAPRLAVLCYDIIPLMFPRFFTERDVSRFRACFHAVFHAADTVIVTAQRIERDVQGYCDEHRLALKSTAVVALGAEEKSDADANAVLPQPLRPNRYMLYVSTIEPRKNHRMLFRVWMRLLAAGVSQACDFKLVLVGRRGWQSDDLLADMEASPAFGVSLLLLSDVDDATLAQLYENAAFCVYPSLYEGFGLPIVESFMHGKTVIASNGGALPETVKGFSPCLDPNDEDGWFAMIRNWIVDPAGREHYESLVRNQFKIRDWDQASRDVFDAIDNSAHR